MKSKNFCLLTVSIFLFSATLFAQETPVSKTTDSITGSNNNNPDTAVVTIKNNTGDTLYAKNYFKVNLAALLLKNYSFQYERILSRKISIAIGFRTMPNTSVPFKNYVKEIVGDDDQETEDQIENLRMSSTAITPEVRIYLGKKGYGRGFYVAPFYRYGKYDVKGVDIKYDDGLGGESTMTMSGKLTGNSFGLMLGAQWFLGKHISLDWWMLGPHYGSGKGELTGVASKPLTIDEQADIRETLEDIDIPSTSTSVTVNANGANLKLDGPFAGIRWGLVLGFKF